SARGSSQWQTPTTPSPATVPIRKAARRQMRWLNSSVALMRNSMAASLRPSCEPCARCRTRLSRLPRSPLHATPEKYLNHAMCGCRAALLQACLPQPLEARMQTAKVKWIGEQRFVATSPSGHAIALDSDRTANTAPGAMELLLMALGACTGTDVVSILEKKRQ